MSFKYIFDVLIFLSVAQMKKGHIFTLTVSSEFASRWCKRSTLRGRIFFDGGVQHSFTLSVQLAFLGKWGKFGSRK